MPGTPSRKTRQRQSQILGFIILAAALAAGLLLGTESTLILRRDASGAVTAVNTWRYAGRIPLIFHSVTHLREVQFETTSRTGSDHQSTYGLLNGASKLPEHPVLVGDGRFAYSYRDDVGLIEGFLRNPHNTELVLTHPMDIRRTVASWGLLAFVALGVVGWIWKLVLGRDPLAGADRSVTPLPPAIGQTIFVGLGVGLVWFFLAGDHVFGPLATRKVKLLEQSAGQDDPAGIARAIHEGVFIDCRDGQGMTALMLAVRAGAAKAVDALLAAGANPNLRTSSDETALLMAIHRNHTELVDRLLQAAPDLSIADSDGRNALHAAAERGDAATLGRILKAGSADAINQADNHGWTPLLFAAASGHQDAVQLLLDAGADAQQKLPDGRTAADLGRSVREMGGAQRKAAP